MAPSGGQKLGKLVHPACQHSPFAKAYLCSHLCWQDRIAKEQSAAAAVGLKPAKEQAPVPPRKSQSLTALELARSEYHPIGGFTVKNNNSGQISVTLGPKTWHASGGLKSEYRCQVGQTTLPAFGSPPEPPQDLSASYLPKAVRAEGRQRARADQVEAIRQHGENTILGLKRGDIAAINPAEEQVLQGAGAGGSLGSNPRRATSGGASVRSGISVDHLLHGGLSEKVERRPIRTGNSGVSRVSSAQSGSDSWGSVRSNPAGELQRIHELAAKARDIGKRGAHAECGAGVRHIEEDELLFDLHHPDFVTKK